MVQDCIVWKPRQCQVQWYLIQCTTFSVPFGFIFYGQSISQHFSEHTFICTSILPAYCQFKWLILCSTSTEGSRNCKLVQKISKHSSPGESMMADVSPRTDTSTDASTEDKNSRVRIYYFSSCTNSFVLLIWYFFLCLLFHQIFTFVSPKPCL